MIQGIDQFVHTIGTFPDIFIDILVPVPAKKLAWYAREKMRDFKFVIRENIDKCETIEDIKRVLKVACNPFWDARRQHPEYPKNVWVKLFD
jgi:hypothetical protein